MYSSHSSDNVTCLRLSMHGRPIRLDLAAMTLLGAGRREQPLFKRRIGQLIGQRPIQPGDLKTLDRRAHRRGGHPYTAGPAMMIAAWSDYPAGAGRLFKAEAEAAQARMSKH